MEKLFIIFWEYDAFLWTEKFDFTKKKKNSNNKFEFIMINKRKYLKNNFFFRNFYK